MPQLFYIFFLLPLAVVCAESDVTFENVEFKGYSVYTLKFTKTIKKSNELKKHVPEVPYDHLEFVDQNIPILHRNSITDMDSLDELTIANCKLKEIKPGAFKNLPNLRRLSLKDNNLEEVEAGVYNYLPLSMLDLSNNKITNIEASALDHLPNILNINFADNRIKEWNKRWFYDTPLLTRISMQNNSLEKIPNDAFHNLYGDKKFGSVQLKINLVFSYNKISQIDDNAFTGLKQINHLWLDNNKLTEFKDNLLVNVEVEDLRIGHNQIHCLTGDLSKIIKGSVTWIDGNPFDCECLENISKWAKDHNKNADMFYSEMNCSAERIRRKMDDLEKRLKELNRENEIEETTRNGENTGDEVEIIFK